MPDTEKLCESLSQEAIDTALLEIEKEKEEWEEEYVYAIKRAGNLSFLLQNKNGPCPLIAVANILLFRGKISFREDQHQISFQELVQVLADYLIQNTPDQSDTQLLTYQQTLSEVLQLLPTLDHGLDVNIHFSGPLDFESSASMCLFDIFNIKLVHGWVCDPRDDETYQTVVKKLKSYNAVVEAIVAGQESTDNDSNVITGIVCSQFLEATASQLTSYGLKMLVECLDVGKPALFFRNNHFSTIIKTSDNRLMTLVTDRGYQDQTNIIWESIDLLGNSELYDAYFNPYHPSDMYAVDFDPIKSFEPVPTDQSQSYDYELARAIQAEEDARFEQMNHQRQPTSSSIPQEPTPVSTSSQSSRKKDKTKCFIQ